MRRAHGHEQDRQTDISFITVISSVKTLGLFFIFSLSNFCQEKSWGIKGKKKKSFKVRMAMCHLVKGQDLHQGNIQQVHDVPLSGTALCLIVSKKDIIIF